MNMSELEYRKPLQWGEIDPYRRGRTHVGMWAWLLQRVSAVFIVFLLVLHLCFTYKPYLQFLLLLAVAFHASLGLRVILLDFNLAKISSARRLVPWTLGLGVAARGHCVVCHLLKEVRRMPCNRQKLFATYAYSATILSKAAKGRSKATS